MSRVKQYELKGGEYVKDGLLIGWTGDVCPSCGGTGEQDPDDWNGGSRLSCNDCGGTGELHGVMPHQPENLGPDIP